LLSLWLLTEFCLSYFRMKMGEVFRNPALVTSAGRNIKDEQCIKVAVSTQITLNFIMYII